MIVFSKNRCGIALSTPYLASVLSILWQLKNPCGIQIDSMWIPWRLKKNHGKIPWSLKTIMVSSFCTSEIYTNNMPIHVCDWSWLSLLCPLRWRWSSRRECQSGLVILPTEIKAWLKHPLIDLLKSYSCTYLRLGILLNLSIIPCPVSLAHNWLGPWICVMLSLVYWSSVMCSCQPKIKILRPNTVHQPRHILCPCRAVLVLFSWLA